MLGILFLSRLPSDNQCLSPAQCSPSLYLSLVLSLSHLRSLSHLMSLFLSLTRSATHTHVVSFSQFPCLFLPKQNYFLKTNRPPNRKQQFETQPGDVIIASFCNRVFSSPSSPKPSCVSRIFISTDSGQLFYSSSKHNRASFKKSNSNVAAAAARLQSAASEAAKLKPSVSLFYCCTKTKKTKKASFVASLKNFWRDTSFN